MIGRQCATPPEGVRSRGLPWTEVEAGQVLSTPIVDRVAELDGATWAVGCNVNCCRIDDNEGSTTGQPLNGGGTHRHTNVRDMKCRGRRTHACWPNQWRNQLIGTGHFDPTWFRVGMIGRQCPTPPKGVCSRGLSWTEVEAGHVLSTPIVDRVAEQDSATWAVGCNVNCCRIGHGQVRTAGDARD